MKTYYSILLSANLSLPYLIITCVSYWYSPRGGILQPTVLHQVLLVNQCGSQIREPQELTPSNHIHRRSLTIIPETQIHERQLYNLNFVHNPGKNILSI
jgi:hypothetical protein